MIDDMAGECSTSSGTAFDRYLALNDGDMRRDKAVREVRETISQLLAACELADQILARDGLQEIRGLAWHDGERFVIQEAIRRAKGEK